MSTQPKTENSAGNSPSTSQIRLGAVLAVAFALGLLVWLVFLRDDDGSGSESAAEPTTGLAAIVTPEALAAEAKALGRPVYWAGEQGGESLEFVRDAEGNVTVRYLTEGVEAGDERQDYLFVGTYPVPAAFQIQQDAAGEGLTKRTVPGGGIATADVSKPTNVYLAYPGEDFQIEIYDPRPGRALQLAVGGEVVPAG